LSRDVFKLWKVKCKLKYNDLKFKATEIYLNPGLKSGAAGHKSGAALINIRLELRGYKSGAAGHKSGAACDF
jgi:hypothetical protein